MDVQKENEPSLQYFPYKVQRRCRFKTFMSVRNQSFTLFLDMNAHVQRLINYAFAQIEFALEYTLVHLKCRIQEKETSRSNSISTQIFSTV